MNMIEAAKERWFDDLITELPAYRVALGISQTERAERFGEPAVDRGEKTRQQYNHRKKGRPKAYGPRSKMTLRLLAGIGTVSLREKA